jgi:SAM-dependent methyltransferase
MQVSQWPEWYCPLHKKPLVHQGNTLFCPSGDSFPIERGIPRFVPISNYADAFGLQWKRYRLTQLDSYSGTTISRDRIRRCLGQELWADLANKQILECGCGAGRFTEILLGKGAQVTSIDLSDAVDANMENFPVSDTHRVAQADILKIPFKERQFDVVFCLGVIQHTPNPKATIAQLYEQVKPGGSLVIDHYTHSLSIYTKTSLLIRPFLKRLPPADGIKWTEWLVDTLLPVHKKVRHFRPAQMFLSRISPVRCYYRAFPQLSDKLHREWALLDTHDSLTDWFKHLRTQKQIRRMLEHLGLREIWCEYGGNGIEGRGKRPSALGTS